MTKKNKTEKEIENIARQRKTKFYAKRFLPVMVGKLIAGQHPCQGKL